MKWSSILQKNNLPHMTFHDLRHENVSIMHMLNVPDKYAMERGSWKTDKVMKRVYTHTFPEQRVQVDNVIDKYFEKTLKLDIQDIDIQKYNSWLTLFDKTDSEASRREFKYFMQHKIQHEPR